MNTIFIHNGNVLVKQKLSNLYKNVKILPNIGDTWIIDNKSVDTFEKRVDLLKDSKHACTDLTITEHVNYLEFARLTADINVIKVISTRDSDLLTLDASWNNSDYTESDWLRAVVHMTSLSDSVMFYNSLPVPSSDSVSPIVFTPGRSGTHVLADIINVREIMHHGDVMFAKDSVNTLINASIIYSTLRESFHSQVMSDVIANRYGVMLTTSANIEHNKRTVLSWTPVNVSDEDIYNSFKKIVSYADILLGMKSIFNKNIKFSIFEHLLQNYSNANFVKNPYLYEDVIANYGEVVSKCSDSYQPVYQKILNRIKQQIGTSVYY